MTATIAVRGVQLGETCSHRGCLLYAPIGFPWCIRHDSFAPMLKPELRAEIEAASQRPFAESLSLLIGWLCAGAWNGERDGY